MQQGRRSASMKASYEALQQFAQSTDVGVLGITPSLSLPSSDVRDTAGNATVLASAVHSTKKQKKYDHYYFLVDDERHYIFGGFLLGDENQP